LNPIDALHYECDLCPSPAQAHKQPRCAAVVPRHIFLISAADIELSLA
jgi:hypothetical protein